MIGHMYTLCSDYHSQVNLLPHIVNFFGVCDEKA